MDDSTEEASTEVVSKPKMPQPPPAPPQPLPEKEEPIKEEEAAEEEEEEEEEIPTLCPNTGMLLTAAGLATVEDKKPEIEEDKETVAEPLYEEDIIDGFSICSFKDYDDLEVGNPCVFGSTMRPGCKGHGFVQQQQFDLAYVMTG